MNESSDQVMVQGLQTLSDSTVSDVSGQDGVAQAAGGLSLRAVKIDGQFSQGTIEQDGPPSGGLGGQSGQSGQSSGGRINGGGANFNVDNYSIYGVDAAKSELGPLTASKITAGRAFTPEDAEAKVAIVDADHATQKSLAVDQKLTVSGTEYTIVGIATADSGDAAANVNLPLHEAQTLAGKDAQITTVYVKATDSTRIDAVKSQIQQNIPGTTVTTSQDLASTVSGSLSTASDLATNVGKWLSIAVLAAAFLVAGLLTSSAVSRRVREFGTLKALGWKSGRVTRQVMGEALVNGLIGGVLGIGLGLGAAAVVSAVSPELTASLPGASGPGGSGGFGGPARQAAEKTLQVSLDAPVSAGTITVAVVLAVAGGLIAGAFGGWRASRLRPAEALRRVE